ncbi:hypothetical protein FQN57_001523 [Myotisia sp. PD_48]|nr:hypothetical protein FQN57_001523 [Myotisia sp. PD_48]
MPLGLIAAIAACPAIVGTNEAIQTSQKQQAKERHRGRKMNLIVSCVDASSRKSRDVSGCYIILKGGRLFAATIPEDNTSSDIRAENNMSPPGHLFQGYYFKHPDYTWTKGEGLVSTISDDPPMLNWIYVDKETYSVKYGTRKESEGNYLGPWDCTPVAKRLTFEGWEGFCIAEEKDDELRRMGLWGLYFDCDDNGLREKVDTDRRVLEVELVRREMRLPPTEEENGEPE